MPVSISTARDPFRGAQPQPAVNGHAPTPTPVSLKVPQARVLRALMPTYPDDPQSEWPMLTRAMLGVRAGYTPISGSITRALSGIKATNKTSGEPHPGVIELGLVVVIELDVEGRKEDNYQITPEGVRAFQHFMEVGGGKLPPLRSREACINRRYKESEEQLTNGEKDGP